MEPTNDSADSVNNPLSKIMDPEFKGTVKIDAFITPCDIFPTQIANCVPIRIEGHPATKCLKCVF